MDNKKPDAELQLHAGPFIESLIFSTDVEDSDLHSSLAKFNWLSMRVLCLILDEQRGLNCTPRNREEPRYTASSMPIMGPIVKPISP